MQGLVTISHAFALGTVDAGRQAALIELLATADIALDDGRARQPRTAAAGGAARRRACASGWARTASGTTGRRTATVTCLERAWQLAFRNGFRHDELVELCVDVASRGGRAIVGAATWSSAAIADDAVTGLAPGAPADLVVVAADTVTAAVMDHPPRTLVIRGGDVIARDGQLC